jgi:hypothetical protein
MTDVSASIEAWFRTRIPAHWNASGFEIVADQDEILVVIDLVADADRTADRAQTPEGTGPELAGIHRFREHTRDERMAIARSAEQAFGQKVSWGARSGDVAVIFTTTSIPVMTRLRLPERRVLDTLIDAGVARSRSEALAWCVRLVGEKEKEWIVELRTAFEAVDAARARGPKARRPRGEQSTGEPAACE